VVVGLLEDLAGAGSFFVSFTGGEVALRRDLFVLIARARRLHFLVRLLSTGTRWTPSEWDKLAELGVDEVRMSLYSHTAELHDRITGIEGSHMRTLATARGLRARGVGVTIGCPILRTNVAAVIPLVDWCRDEGLPLSLDANVTWTDRSDPSPALLRASQAELAPLMARQDIRETILGTPKPSDSWSGTESTCSAGHESAFIQCTGNVYPCSNWPAAAGNILRTPFLDIWRSSEGFVAARSICNDELIECNACALRGRCRPCVAMNMQEHGAVQNASAAACTAARAAQSPEIKTTWSHRG